MNGNGENNNINLIYFSAEWCGPCRIQDPMIEELRKKFGDKINLKKIDVDSTCDETIDLISRYSVHAVPTMIFIKNGNIYKKYVGITDEDILIEKAEEIMREV